MTTGWAQLDAPPAEAVWEFPAEEYRRRLAGARTRMAALGLDCLFLTGEKNIRYLTGFHTQIWVSPTRPRYVIVPLEGEPVAIVPVTNVPGFRQTSWIADVRSWAAPRPADDGVSLVVDAVRACVRPGGRVGAELGPETRLEIPAGDFPADPRHPRRDASRGCEPGPPAAAYGQERPRGGPAAKDCRACERGIRPAPGAAPAGADRA